MITKTIKRLFRNIESTITSVLVIALIGGTATILVVFKLFLKTLLSPAPLWAIIVLTLTCLIYTNIKISKQIKCNKSTINDKFHLKMIEAGTHVFVNKVKIEGNEPWYCTNCMKKGIESILQYDTTKQLNGTQKYMICQECNNSISVQSWNIPGWTK